ncbi:PAS domain S-box protein [bacterium]|nr:PAS domain S-box protein [bacterium]
MPGTELIENQKRKGIKCSVPGTFKTGYSGVYNKEYIRKNGTVFPIRMQAWLTRDEKGVPSRLLGIVRDVSKKQKK